jgi:YidC/Oxa1 family membrane protein insertase
LLNFLYTAVSWVLLRWHDLFSTFLNPGSGLAWALSIFMLVVTIRILLFRFFIRQVHSQRKMQEVQPKIAALREKYKNDRQTLSQEMMKLQKEEGFNPLSGCLPILLQAPVFLALFHVLRVAADPRGGGALIQYGWNWTQVGYALNAKLFGAPIAAAFRTPASRIIELGGSVTATHIVTFVLILLMCSATFITQRQIMARNTQALDAQQAMIQRLLLYGVPISLFVSGFLFPIGVLLYWFTNNLWTMGQQFYILKRMPHPSAKKDERPAIDPKLLAPRPGQKPVRPERRPSSAPAASGEASPSGAAAENPNGKADARPAGASQPASPSGRQPTQPPPPTKPQDGATGQQAARTSGNGSTPAVGDDSKDEAEVAGAAGGQGQRGGAKPAPRTGGRPGGSGRRPPGQRSSTQTRAKKKRR